MLLLRSRIAIARGRTDEALAAAEEAVAVVLPEVLDPMRSATSAAAWATLAEAQRRSARVDAAADNYARAQAAFAVALGADHASTRAASAALVELRAAD